MNKIKKIFVVVMVLFLFSSCGKNTDSKKVVIYMSLYKDSAEKITQKLNQKFPEYNIEYLSAGTGVLQTKLSAEADTGKFSCDMLIVAEPSYAINLKEKGYLEAVDINNKENLLFEYDKDGFWYPFRALNMVLAYNKDKLTDITMLPTSFKDLLNDECRDYVSIPDAKISGTAQALYTVLVEKYGEEYLEKLSKLNPVIESGLNPITKLETGEMKLIIALEDAILKKQSLGSSLGIVYPEDFSLLVPSPIMTMKSEMSANNNIEACKKITEYLLSEEGQKLIVDELFVQPVISGVKNQGKYNVEELLTKSQSLDWKKLYENKNNLINLIDKYMN